MLGPVDGKCGGWKHITIYHKIELRNKINVKVNDVFFHEIVTVIEFEFYNVSKNEGGSETAKRSHKRHMVKSKDN